MAPGSQRRCVTAGLLLLLLAAMVGSWRLQAVSCGRHGRQRRSFRMMARRSTPIMTLMLATRNWTNKLGLPVAWEGAVLGLMRQIEQSGIVATKRLASLSPSAASAALGVASKTGPGRKLVSVYRRSKGNATCAQYFSDAKSFCGVASEKYKNHKLRDATKLYLEAMKRFQRGIDCYSTRVSWVLTRELSPSPSFALAGFSKGEEEGVHDWLQEYRKASSHSFRLRLQGYLMWYTLKRLGKALDYVLKLTAVTEAEELDDAATKVVLSTAEELGVAQKGLELEKPQSPFEEAMKTINNLAGGNGDANDATTLAETARAVGELMSGLGASSKGQPQESVDSEGNQAMGSEEQRSAGGEEQQSMGGEEGVGEDQQSVGGEQKQQESAAAAAEAARQQAEVARQQADVARQEVEVARQEAVAAGILETLFK